MQWLYHRYKDQTVFPLPLHQNSSLPREGCSSRGYYFKCNYFKTSAWCYRTFFWGPLEFQHRKRTLIIIGLICNYYIHKKQAAQFSFCIIPHNEPHRERIEELFSVNLNTGSVSSLTSDVDWFCGSRSLALNRMQTFIWAMGPVCNFSSRVQSLFKQVTYVSRSYWWLHAIPEGACTSVLTWGEIIMPKCGCGNVNLQNSTSCWAVETIRCRTDGYFPKRT